MRLQFANRSIAKPKHKSEDVFVKVDKFLFFVEYVILKADREVPIILGQQFLWTSHAFIDVHQGELTMWFNNEEVKFSVVNAMRFSTDVENCNAIESIGLDYCKEEVFAELFGPE